MNQLEQNIANSFRMAKSDIIQLQNDVIKLSEVQKDIINMLKDFSYDTAKVSQCARDVELVMEKVKSIEQNVSRLRSSSLDEAKKALEQARKLEISLSRSTTPPKTKIVKVSTRAKKTYVSSKDSKKFHIESCPFAQNIIPKHRVTYKSKTRALNEGLKPCKCVK